MYNSTIITKKKQLACGHFDYNFSKNRCRQCATIQSTQKRIEQSKKLLPKNNMINKATFDEELNEWFEERRKEMKGVCSHCGGKSCKDSDKYYKFSIAHLLPKAYFQSIATHPDNWIELCFWSKNCHGNMDAKILELSEMNCWDEIVTKFQKLYPHIAKHEKRRIPEILLQYIEIDI